LKKPKYTLIDNDVDVYDQLKFMAGEEVIEMTGKRLTDWDEKDWDHCTKIYRALRKAYDEALGLDKFN